MCPFGMNQAELVEAAGGFKSEPEKLISGGPMMGFAMFTLDVPVTKTSSAILGFTRDQASKFESTACINCGRCVEACPSRLIPSRLADYAEHHDEEAFTAHEGSGMYGMWLLQLTYVLQNAAETGDRFHEKDCACEPQEEIIKRMLRKR